MCVVYVTISTPYIAATTTPDAIHYSQQKEQCVFDICRFICIRLCARQPFCIHENSVHTYDIPQVSCIHYAHIHPHTHRDTHTLEACWQFATVESVEFWCRLQYTGREFPWSDDISMNICSIFEMVDVRICWMFWQLSTVSILSECTIIPEFCRKKLLESSFLECCHKPFEHSLLNGQFFGFSVRFIPVAFSAGAFFANST